jgi:hypothetical protein
MGFATTFAVILVFMLMITPLTAPIAANAALRLRTGRRLTMVLGALVALLVTRCSVRCPSGHGRSTFLFRSGSVLRSQGRCSRYLSGSGA